MTPLATSSASRAESPWADVERLDFLLPDFTRVAWVGDEARDVWQPRIARIAAAWTEIEWRAVVDGVRRCAIATLGPDEFVEAGARWAEFGLAAVPLETLGVSGQPYSATSTPPEPGGPFVFRLVVGRPADVAAFRHAWDATDDEAVGDLLGYPACCREFFRRTWVDDALVDTTWPMAAGSGGSREGSTIEVGGPFQANILWRWMGVRAVPHLPCRFDCPATVALADRLADVGRRAGFGEEIDWMQEILSWPVEWSALHGIAEVKSPVLRVSTRTDATATRIVVRRHGDRFPAEGARGLAWPYEVPVRLRLTGTPGFRRGLDRSADEPAREAWYATDNGFSSVAAMDDAQRPIVAAAVAALGGAGGPVVDLGCGNGALLEKIVGTDPGVVPSGIDADPQHIEHARALHRANAERFVVGDLFDDRARLPEDHRFELALVMPGRLLETDPARADELRGWLRERVDRVLVYAYGDWLARPGGLRGLAADAGFQLAETSEPTVGLATVTDQIRQGAGG